MLRKILGSIFSRENLIALMLALIITTLVVLTADTTPDWIYQGF